MSLWAGSPLSINDVVKSHCFLPKEATAVHQVTISRREQKRKKACRRRFDIDAIKGRGNSPPRVDPAAGLGRGRSYRTLNGYIRGLDLVGNRGIQPGSNARPGLSGIPIVTHG